MTADKASPGAADSKARPAQDRLLDGVREILKLWANTISLIKIFSIDHTSANKFFDELDGKLRVFLNIHPRLEIRVKEFSFTFLGEEVYREENPLKSLPFLFFKDGVAQLMFLKGLDRSELVAFLEVIKNVAQLPPEKSDIVTALWEKDFLNIRYIALDNFLESKIGKGMDAIDTQFDRGAMSSGRIELDPEDRMAIEKSRQSGGENSKQAATEKQKLFMSLPSGTIKLETEEQKSLDSILHFERGISPLEELIDLMVELLYLEERTDLLVSNLEIIGEYHKDFVNRGDLERAVVLLNGLGDLSASLASSAAERSNLIADFSAKLKSGVPLDRLKTLYRDGSIDDIDSLLTYLDLIGPRGFNLISDLLKETLDINFRKKAVAHLRSIGDRDIASLRALIDENNPVLTVEVIKILAESKDPRAVDMLSSFSTFTNRAIKAEAIRTLGRIGRADADRVLFRFVADPDPNLRSLAVNMMRAESDRSILDHFLALATRKDFFKLSKEEKRAVLNFLARSRQPSALDILRDTVKRKRWLPSRNWKETRLLSIAALELMATPGAMEVIGEGSRIRNRAIRQACRLILRRKSRIS